MGFVHVRIIGDFMDPQRSIYYFLQIKSTKFDPRFIYRVNHASNYMHLALSIHYYLKVFNESSNRQLLWGGSPSVLDLLILGIVVWEFLTHCWLCFVMAKLYKLSWIFVWQQLLLVNNYSYEQKDGFVYGWVHTFVTLRWWTILLQFTFYAANKLKWFFVKNKNKNKLKWFNSLKSTHQSRVCLYSSFLESFCVLALMKL